MIFRKTNILLNLALALAAHGLQLQVEGRDTLRETGGASVGMGKINSDSIDRSSNPPELNKHSTFADSTKDIQLNQVSRRLQLGTTPPAPTPFPSSAPSDSGPTPRPTVSTSPSNDPLSTGDPTYFASFEYYYYDVDDSGPTPSPSNDPLSTSPSNNPLSTGDVSGPWDINFIDLSADFSVNSNEELVLNYEIGKGRQFDSFLFMKDCITNVTDIAINYTEPLVNNSPAEGADPSSSPSYSPTFDKTRGRAMQGIAPIATLSNIFDSLTLGYDIDKSMIANSSIWNATSSQIELCQVVQLKEGTLVITEDKRQVSIDFDLSVDYEVSDIALGAETINAGNDTVDASSYIEACKCDGVSFVCNTDDLVPNSPLIVCIKSISPDLEIDFLESMNITQGDQDMAVVTNQVIVFTSFTSVEYVSAQNGVVVSTRVPANVFDYNTVGSVIGITGGLVMKLPGSGRNLKTDIGAKLDASEEASFEIEVTLQRELGFVEENSLNSAANVASSKGVIGHVMLLACAYAMW